MAKAPYPSEQAERFIVRLPEGMRERIRQAAEQRNRSMNAEVVARLARSFAQDAPGRLTVSLPTDYAGTNEARKKAIIDLQRALSAYVDTLMDSDIKD